MRTSLLVQGAHGRRRASAGFDVEGPGHIMSAILDTRLRLGMVQRSLGAWLRGESRIRLAFCDGHPWPEPDDYRRPARYSTRWDVYDWFLMFGYQPVVSMWLDSDDGQRLPL